MNKIELVPEERQKILRNPDLILLDKELLLALLKDSDFPDEENLVDIRNIFLKKLGEKVEKLKKKRYYPKVKGACVRWHANARACSLACDGKHTCGIPSFEMSSLLRP